MNYADTNPFIVLLNQGGSGLRGAYTWDAENRLVGVEPLAPDPNAHKVTFVYDYVGRRVAKKVYNWDVSDANNPHWTTAPAAERRFVWSGAGSFGGWLMLMELDPKMPVGEGTGLAPVRKYTWGLDLSGQNGAFNSLEGAGTIGGLLAVLDTSGTPQDANDDLSYAYFYDGNGNVGQVLDLGYPDPNDPNGAIMARYEYDPYGNETVAAGPYTRAVWLRDAATPEQAAEWGGSDFLRYADSAGRFADVHALRTTFATNRIAAGTDVKTAQALLGHASATMTLDVYARAFRGSGEAAISRLPSYEPDAREAARRGRTHDAPAHCAQRGAESAYSVHSSATRVLRYAIAESGENHGVNGDLPMKKAPLSRGCKARPQGDSNPCLQDENLIS